MKNNLKCVVLLAVWTGALSVVAGESGEDLLVVVTDKQCESVKMPCDLRTSYPVRKLEDEPALRGLMYSALGWVRNAAADETRTATITARAGTLVDGAFTPDGTAEITVLPAATGEGTCDWTETAISKKVYRLTHTVKKGEVVDASAYLYGYLDFTHCAVHRASQADVEAAALGAITHEIAVVQDEVWPWQPVDMTTVRSGIATDETLEPEARTATTFSFKGCGIFRCEYILTGGMLEVVVDGETFSTVEMPTAGWEPCQIQFDGYGAHVVVFRFTSGGDGVTGLRDVCWDEPDESSRVIGRGDGVRVDLRGRALRDGVLLRTPKRMAEVLPFEYSSTNWIGDVIGVTAESVARVTICPLQGTDDDVTTWEEVSDKKKTLVDKVGEGQIKWRPYKGVWKAQFEILNGSSGIHQETVIFDLRNTSGPGLALILR